MSEIYGDQFQQKSKYHRDRMPGGRGMRGERPAPVKTYPDAERVTLPSPAAPHRLDLSEALRRRKSIRDYTDEPLSLETLSYLLWAAGGIQRVEHGYPFRTAPSAGALYPVETYLAVRRVDGLEPGLYHFAVEEHALELLRGGEAGAEVAAAALGQRMCARAAVVFCWTAVFQRCKWKYGQRAYRYVYLDAGHIAENLALAAVQCRLGSCQIGALFDDEVNRLLDVDGREESVLYLTCVGHPR
jgi:SagB-type dehydrogenase family enzyme